jgi:hypothetical protein
MATALSNMAAVAAAQLSINSALTITTSNMNVSYIRATADSLSSSGNTTNFTGASTVNIPSLCDMLDSSIDCANVALVQQVNQIFIFIRINLINLIKLYVHFL